MTYPPPGPWQPPEPPPVGDPVYVEQQYPYPYPPAPHPYTGAPDYPYSPYATGPAQYAGGPAQYAGGPAQYAGGPAQYAGGPAQYPYPGGPAPYAPWGYPAPPRPVPVAPPASGYGLVAAAVLIAAAAFMPWAQVFGVSVDGTDGTGDGNWTLFLGAIIGGMGIVVALWQGRLWAPVTAVVAAAFVVLTAVKDITDVNGFANENGIDPSAVNVGLGLWLTLLAGLAAAAFAVVGISRRTARSR